MKKKPKILSASESFKLLLDKYRTASLGKHTVSNFSDLRFRNFDPISFFLSATRVFDLDLATPVSSLTGDLFLCLFAERRATNDGWSCGQRYNSRQRSQRSRRSRRWNARTRFSSDFPPDRYRRVKRRWTRARAKVTPPTTRIRAGVVGDGPGGRRNHRRPWWIQTRTFTITGWCCCPVACCTICGRWSWGKACRNCRRWRRPRGSPATVSRTLCSFWTWRCSFVPATSSKDWWCTTARNWPVIISSPSRSCWTCWRCCHSICFRWTSVAIRCSGSRGSSRSIACTITTTWSNRGRFIRTCGVCWILYIYCWYWLIGSAAFTTCSVKRRDSKGTGSTRTGQESTRPWPESISVRCTGPLSPSPRSATYPRRRPTPSEWYVSTTVHALPLLSFSCSSSSPICFFFHVFFFRVSSFVSLFFSSSSFYS